MTSFSTVPSCSAVRLLLCAGVALVVTASASSALRAPADLRIVRWPNGQSGGGAKTWTLRCQPVGGTLPRATRACDKLASVKAPFVPVRPDVLCSEIYGGPQVALVRGTFRGRRISTLFKRTDSCQIARWNRVSFLFPPSAAA